MSNRLVPYEDGMKIGLGYDRLNSDTSSTSAITWSGTSGPLGGGQQVSADCIVIQDVEQLHTALGINAEAGGAYLGFSASAKVEYARTCDFSAFSTYALIRVSVQNAFQSVDGPKFNDEALDLIRNEHPDRFRLRFKDAFIAGQKTGGEYFAIYQFTSTNQVERENLAVQVHAAFNGLITKADLNTSITSALSSTQSHLELKVHVFRQGTISEVNFQLEDIVATARKFPVDVSTPTASFPYTVLLQDYDGLWHPGDSYNFYDIQNQKDVLDELARKRFQFLSLRDDLSYALQHLDDFQNADGSPIDRSRLDIDRLRVVDDINSMQRLAAACARDASACTFPSFDLGSYQRPILKPSAAAAGHPDTPAVPGLLRLTPLTAPGTFPPDAHVPNHGGTLDNLVGIVPDQQGHPTVVDQTGTVTKLQGVTLSPEAWVTSLQQGSTGSTFIPVCVAIDKNGRMNALWLDARTTPPIWRTDSLGTHTFPPDARVSFDGSVALAVDNDSNVAGFSFANVEPSHGHAVELGPVPFTPGAALGGVTIDNQGRLCTVAYDGGWSPTAVHVTSIAAGFVAGGAASGDGQHSALAIDAQGRLTAVWRANNPNPGPWQLDAITPATFVPGGPTTGQFGTKPIQHSPYPLDYTFGASTAFAVDRLGQLNTVERLPSQSLRESIVSPISKPGSFPPGAAVTVLSPSAKRIVAVAVDSWGRINVTTYRDSQASWETSAVASSATFLPGSQIAAGGRTGAAIDKNGTLTLVTPDWQNLI